MALDIHSEQSNIKIECFSSVVIEMVSVVDVLINSTHHSHLKDWIKSMKQSLSDLSMAFLDKIKALPIQGLEYTEFLLDIQIFNDSDLFIKSLSKYSDAEFIKVFTDHQIDEKLYKEYLQNEKKPEELADVIYHTREYKESYIHLLEEIKESTLFQERLRFINNEYKESIQTIQNKLESKQPLDLAQELMGKKFYTVYDYKYYIFCPSYFLSPKKLRVHNHDRMITIYDLRNTTTNTQKIGDELSHQLKIISDRTRLEIIRKLSMGPIYGKLLANSLDLTTATISHHLDLLREIGLIKEEKVKNTKYFRLNEDKLQEIITKTKQYMDNKIE